MPPTTGDSPLAVGQAIVVRIPRTLHTVRTGDTLYSLAQHYGVSVRTLLRRNFCLHGSTALRAGETIVIDYADEAPLARLGVNAYAYPYIAPAMLDALLPYLTYLTPFTYGITPEGGVVPAADSALLAAASRCGVSALMHLSTLTSEGSFSSGSAAALLRDERAQTGLSAAVCRLMEEKAYYGLDIDFEYVPPALREAYAAFVCRLRETLNAENRPVIAALAPKTSAQQRGLLYEAHDYALLSEAANAVFLMTYEWGYTYGEPMAVAPLPQVRAVLDYALTETVPEKIFLGLALYGYDWLLPYEAGITKAETLSSQQAAERAARLGAEIFFDETAQSPYYHYRDSARREHVVWFEDARSLEKKLRLAAQSGLQGVGCWHLGRALTQFWPLLDALADIEVIPRKSPQ